MINREQLGKLSAVEISDVNAGELVEIDTVPVSYNLPKELRIMQYIERIKNPYCFKDGGNIVKTQFAATGISLYDALVNSALR